MPAPKTDLMCAQWPLHSAYTDKYNLMPTKNDKHIYIYI